jgi:hypothetical protein
VIDAVQSAVADKVDKLFGDNWPIRRRIMFLFIGWEAVVVTWVIIRGTDSSLYQTTITTMLASMTSILCAYIFGSVWDDHNKRLKLKFQPQGKDGDTSQDDN